MSAIVDYTLFGAILMQTYKIAADWRESPDNVARSFKRAIKKLFKGRVIKDKQYRGSDTFGWIVIRGR